MAATAFFVVKLLVQSLMVFFGTLLTAALVALGESSDVHFASSTAAPHRTAAPANGPANRVTQELRALAMWVGR